MNKNAAEQYFIDGLLITHNAPDATHYAAMRLSSELGRALPSINSRSDVLNYAKKIGIHIDAIDAMISVTETSSSYAPRVCQLVIDEPEKVIDIPDSRCVQRNLPLDRAPTLEEIMKAIEACRKN